MALEEVGLFGQADHDLDRLGRVQAAQVMLHGQKDGIAGPDEPAEVGQAEAGVDRPPRPQVQGLLFGLGAQLAGGEDDQLQLQGLIGRVDQLQLDLGLGGQLERFGLDDDGAGLIRTDGIVGRSQGREGVLVEILKTDPGHDGVSAGTGAGQGKVETKLIGLAGLQGRLQR